MERFWESRPERVKAPYMKPKPVNQNSISSDAFKSVAKVDKECNSYAAELIAETASYFWQRNDFTILN